MSMLQVEFTKARLQNLYLSCVRGRPSEALEQPRGRTEHLGGTANPYGRAEHIN